MKLEPLEPGEVICDKCNGTGKPNNNKIDYRQKYVTYPWTCDKCYGVGKLDWIENVTGKRPRMLIANWNVDWSTAEQLYSPSLDPIIEKISENIAKKIDKQILEGLINESGSWGSDL